MSIALKLRRLIKSLVMLPIACLFCLCLWLEIWGMPQWAVDAAIASLNLGDLRIQAENIKGGIFRGIDADDIEIAFQGQPFFRSRHLRIKFSLIDLVQYPSEPVVLSFLAGQIFPMTMLQGAPAPLSIQTGSLDFNRLSVVGLWQDRHFSLVKLESEINGLQVELRGKIQLPVNFRATARRSFTGFKSPQGLSREDLLGYIQWFKAQHLWTGNARLSMTCQDALEGNAPLLKGDFYVRRLHSAQFPIHDLKSSFALTNSEQLAIDFSLAGEEKEFLKGNATLHLAKRTLEARASGAILPKTLLKPLKGHPVSLPPLFKKRANLLRDIRVTAPMTFQVDLPESPFTPEAWRIKTRFEVPKGSLKEIPFDALQGTITLSLQNREIHLSDLKFNASDSPLIPVLSGNGVYFMDSGKIDAQVTATFFPAALLRKMDAHQPTLFSPPAYDSIRVTAGLSLQNSGFTLSGIKGQLDLAIDHLPPNAAHLKQISGRITFDHGRIAGERITCHRQKRPPILVTFESLLQDSNEVSLDYSITVSQSSAGDNAFTFFGNLSVPFSKSPITGNLKGSLFPDRMYREIREITKTDPIPELEVLTSQAAATEVSMTFALDPAPFKLIRSAGQLEGQDIQYGDFHFTALRTDFQITDKELILSGLTAKAKDKTDLALDLNYQFATDMLYITNGVYEGNPMKIQSFIADPLKKAKYHAVWEDFSWQGENPRFHLNHIAIAIFPLPFTPYLIIDGDLSAKNFTYHSQPVNQLDCRVHLTLPGPLAVDEIALKLNEKTATGKVVYTFEDIEHCVFEVKNLGQDYNPIALLGLINPDWLAIFSIFSFPANPSLDCAGSFLTHKTPNLILSGQLRSSHLKFKDFHFTPITLDFKYDYGMVQWDIENAGFYDGTFNTTGFYRPLLRRGEFSVQFSKARAERLIASFTDKEVKNIDSEQRISGDSLLTFYSDWSHIPLYLRGLGAIRIEGGNIWTIPLFRKLEKFLNITKLSRITGTGFQKLGRIAKLAAQLKFQGKNVAIPRFHTDGTLLALKGSGEYSWLDNTIDFGINVEPLQKIKILSTLLSPISNAFEVELKGTPEAPMWNLK